MSRGHIRAHGDGWRIAVSAGSDPLTGRRHQLSKVIRGSRSDAERALTALLAEVDAGRRNTTNEKTLGDLLDTWLDHKVSTVEESTANNYRWQLSYVPDRLRAMPLGRVDVATLEGLYAHLRRRGNKRNGGGLSAKSVRNIHIAIHGAFELARRYRWVSINPAADAEVPTSPARIPTPAPAASIPRLLAAAAAEHHALPAYLQLTISTGGRRGEIHGIRWSGIDFARAAVVLRDTVAGDGSVKPYTKTGGQRTVLVDPDTLEKLATLRDRAVTDAMTCELPLGADAFVFTDSAVGEAPWKPQTTAARFKRVCAEVGLPAATRLHDLRHLMATHLIDRGVPIPVVSARLGHSQNSTTLNIYTGRVAASDAAAAEEMGRLWES